MEDFEKIDWIWDFLNRYWRRLFDTKYEIPDIDSDSSEDENDDNEYDN